MITWRKCLCAAAAASLLLSMASPALAVEEDRQPAPAAVQPMGWDTPTVPANEPVSGLTRITGNPQPTGRYDPFFAGPTAAKSGGTAAGRVHSDNALLMEMQRTDNEAVSFYTQPVYPQGSMAGMAVQSVSGQIVSDAGAVTDLEKITAIHNWVAKNVYYDYDSLYGDRKDQTAYGVLQSVIYDSTQQARYLAVCDGYSQLTLALLRAQNVPCKYVTGLTASTPGGWDLEDAFGYDTDHAWNLAYADADGDGQREWILLDVTWDSGNTYRGGRYTAGSVRMDYLNPALDAFSAMHKMVRVEEAGLPALYTQADLQPDGTLVLPQGTQTLPENAFAGLAGLTGVTLPEGLQAVGANAFSGCSALTALALPASLAYLGQGFSDGCAALAALSVASDSSAFSAADNVLYDAARTAVYRCAPSSPVSSVSLPLSVKYVLDGAFYQSRLTEISLGQAESIGNSAFRQMPLLISVQIPDSVTRMGLNCFLGSASLQSAEVGSGLSYLSWCAFSGCPSLNSIAVRENNPAYASVDGVLYTKDLTQLAKLPDAYAQPDLRLPDQLRSVGYQAIQQPENSPVLERVLIGEGNEAFQTYEGVWYDKAGTQLILAPPARPHLILLGTLGSIAGSRFMNARYRTVTLLEGITSIGNYAFYGCPNLICVLLPDTIASIGAGFDGITAGVCADSAAQALCRDKGIPTRTLPLLEDDSQPEPLLYAQGAEAQPIAAAVIGYHLSYQWFASADGTRENAIALEGQTGREFTPPTGEERDCWYFARATEACGGTVDTPVTRVSCGSLPFLLRALEVRIRQEDVAQGALPDEAVQAQLARVLSLFPASSLDSVSKVSYRKALKATWEAWDGLNGEYRYTAVVDVNGEKQVISGLKAVLLPELLEVTSCVRRTGDYSLTYAAGAPVVMSGLAFELTFSDGSTHTADITQFQKYGIEVTVNGRNLLDAPVYQPGEGNKVRVYCPIGGTRKQVDPPQSNAYYVASGVEASVIAVNLPYGAQSPMVEIPLSGAYQSAAAYSGSWPTGVSPRWSGSTLSLRGDAAKSGEQAACLLEYTYTDGSKELVQYVMQVGKGAAPCQAPTQLGRTPNSVLLDAKYGQRYVIRNETGETVFDELCTYSRAMAVNGLGPGSFTVSTWTPQTEHTLASLEQRAGFTIDGDVNGDGKTDVLDLVVGKRLLAGLQDAAALYPEYAACGEEVLLDAGDIRAIKRVVMQNAS